MCRCAYSISVIENVYNNILWIIVVKNIGRCGRGHVYHIIYDIKLN